MQRPHVSVALPVKNGMPHLKDAVAGLCRQTYDTITLVVQHSCSTDGSLEYLRSLKTPFPIDIVSEPDGSLVAGYNRALQRCTCDLVVAAACDEVLDDDAIERYVRWHKDNPDAVFIYSGMRLHDGRGGAMRDFQPYHST
jgi:glycosyltransferase involved in cell wall biosynthesis